MKILALGVVVVVVVGTHTFQRAHSRINNAIYEKNALVACACVCVSAVRGTRPTNDKPHGHSAN